MAIDDGVNNIKKLHNKSSDQARNRERQSLFNRLHVILMQAPGADREETRKWLPEVEKLGHSDRVDAIQKRFGEQVLNKCRPALQQLEYVGL